MYCHQVNLHQEFGGAEMYTASLAEALSKLGIATRLYVHEGASFWSRLLSKDVELVSVPNERALPYYLPSDRAWVWTHGALAPEVTQELAPRHLLAAMVHMPRYQRDSSAYAPYHRLYGVSDYVIEGLTGAGLRQVYSKPLYGIADLQLRTQTAAPLISNSRYTWDLRKGRDRILSWVWPCVRMIAPQRTFTRRPGLTLGIVSRLAPIKQFPALFEAISPVLARFPLVNLEIFGSGGYASVRDLTAALKPLGKQVRWWGHQRDVATVYRQLDYLLTGLPEKEALGLNVIEAQAAGTPVLAVDAPPFIETVAHGRTGWLYADPRYDGGVAFASLLDALVEQKLPTLDPAEEHAHLERFTLPALIQRLQPVVNEALAMLASVQHPKTSK